MDWVHRRSRRYGGLWNEIGRWWESSVQFATDVAEQTDQQEGGDGDGVEDATLGEEGKEKKR